MCGRYAISTSRLARIENALGIELPEVQPHYNIAPTQTVPVVRTNEVGGYELVNMRWGLIPGWSKEPRTSYATFNARAETVAEKPAFRAAYRSRRCLVPASGFYEWRDEQGRKQPWYFSAADGQELAFAGLWEEWHGPDAPPVLSCTVIVGTAHKVVEPIHDRMVVILDPEDYATWLDPKQARSSIDHLLRPCPAESVGRRFESAHRLSKNRDLPRPSDGSLSFLRLLVAVQ
jgi:putative SOS response-associated peptidase YedK